MTRPAIYDTEFRKALADEHTDILACPMLEIRQVGPAVINADDRDALIFTSRAGVEWAAPRLSTRKIKCYAVGPGTAQSLVEAGFGPVIDAGGTASHLLDMLSNAPFRNALYLSGKTVTVDIADHFPGRVSRIDVYEAVTLDTIPEHIRDALRTKRNWIAPFYSKRSYETFERLIIESGLQDVCAAGEVIAISNKVTQGAVLPWKKYSVADSPDARGMIDAVKAAA